MNSSAREVARECSRAADEDRMNFPQILGKLAEAGIADYFCDLRRATKFYYLPDGQSLETSAEAVDASVPESFDARAVEAAVRQSQAGTHTYKEFCAKIMRAGCAAYIVSLTGRRAVYFGRSGETHTEHFPSAS